MTWMWAAAVAAPVGYWHPDDLAGRSERYGSSSEVLRTAFEARSAKAEQVAGALRGYREALDLLGARAPAAEEERLEALERAFGRERAVLEAFANDLVADYDEVFTAAVDRAVAGIGEVAICEATVASGPRIPGIPTREQPNPACQGKDLNGDLAAAVDRDTALAGEITALLGREWPEISIPVEPQAPVGGSGEWIGVRELFLAGAREALTAIDRADDEAREEIEAALENDPGPEKLRELEPEARAIDEATAARRAALGLAVLPVAEKRLVKWGEGAGWCASPKLLGGCTGADATSELVSRLIDDPKVAKALP